MSRAAYSSVHFNGNILCAVDIETTGLIYTEHEILQLAVVPLTPDLEVSRQFPIFEMKFRPEKIDPQDIDDTIKVSRKLLANCLNYGIDKDTARERFDDWFNKLALPGGKRIVPLGSNYQFDRDFIREWLGGPRNYEYYFRSDYRDTMLLALGINDLHEWHSERIPFPKVNLGFLSSVLGVTNLNAHDALADAANSAAVYKRLMRFKDFHTIV